MAKDLPQLKEYLDNKNVQWFIYNILKNESDKTSDGKINTGGYNQNAGNSSAFGAGQFIGSTRNNILKEYNVDAWSPDLEEQKLAIVALLDNVGQLDEIKKGDFSSQYDPKKGQWEAFHNKEGILDNKPKKWETEYTTLSDTAVYRPDESWAKIPEDVKVEKLDLFEKKYNGLPTEIVNPIDNVLDPTAEALGLPTSEDVQNQLQAYNDIKAYEELAASDPSIVMPLPNPNYDPNKSISEQYLEFNPELAEYFQGADNIPSPSSAKQPAVTTAPTEDLQTKVQAYNDLKSYDDAVAAGQADFTLANPNYDPDRPQAEQYLDANPDLKNYLQGTTDPSQASASGQPPATDRDTRSMSDIVQLQMGAYEDLLALDKQIALDPESVSLPNPNYDPNRSLAEQYLEFNPNIRPLIERNAGSSTPPSGGDPSLSDGSGVDPSTSSAVAGTAGRESGYEGMSAQDLQNIYQGLLEADAAALAAGEPPALVSGEFEPGPQAPQFLARRMQGVTSANPADANFVGPPEMSLSDPLNPNFVGPPEAPDEPIEPKKPLDPVDRNLLSKLKGQDYTGLLSDIGAYAARIGPLMRAMREASSYDEERYPRFAPILPTATLPKRDVRDAFATAQQAALQQGKLDLGALSALATQQAKETARVEESIANERARLLNQAQQINNQLTMQEMADTAANKGAAQTMKYQTLAAMSEMGQGSLREANMRRNDKIVKEMFSNVFGDEFG